jgi:hypothetical protein
MARKIKSIGKEADKLKQQLEEVQRLYDEAQAEDEALKSQVKSTIDNICNSNDMFCGVILSETDIAKIVELALVKKEAVRIPYNLYFEDKPLNNEENGTV